MRIGAGFPTLDLGGDPEVKGLGEPDQLAIEAQRRLDILYVQVDLRIAERGRGAAILVWNPRANG